MDWLSLVILAGIGLVTWRAYRNGFIRELVSLCAIILAVPLAGVFYDDLAVKLDPIIGSRRMARLAAFLATFGGVVLAGQVGAYLLKRTVAMLNLGGADHLAGGAFGLLKSILVSQALLIALVLFPKPDLRPQIEDSAVARALLDGAPPVLALLPGQFEDTIKPFAEGGLRALEAEKEAEQAPP